jgi:hypothetical protein
MKKQFLLIAIMLMAFSAMGQDFPYSKYLSMNESQLKEMKFKYDKNKNQWRLSKSSTLNNISNVLSAVGGATADVRPDVNDYLITIQEGDSAVAYVDVLFYDDEIYHKLSTFAADNGKNNLETNSGKLIKLQFNYDKYSLLLQTETVGISANTFRTNQAATKSIDESYNIYHFRIDTGIQPTSPWLTKEAIKQQKRDEKGKKKNSAGDLM